MTAWKTADAVVRRLEAAIPVYDVSEQGYSLYVSPVDVRRVRCSRTHAVELRVRDDEGRWAR